jgi:hypothetical protein
MSLIQASRLGCFPAANGFRRIDAQPIGQPFGPAEIAAFSQAVDDPLLTAAFRTGKAIEPVSQARGKSNHYSPTSPTALICTSDTWTPSLAFTSRWQRITNSSIARRSQVSDC